MPPIEVQFLGAARQVTGSCHLLCFNQIQLLLDCGLQQGGAELTKTADVQFDFDPKTIDLLILSHAHIDHSGLLPLLVARGFAGHIYCSSGTALALPVLLKDSVSLYLRELEQHNKKRRRQGLPELQAQMNDDDVEAVLDQLKPLPYLSPKQIAPGVTLELRDAGHILGSAIVLLDFANGNNDKRLVFSGDLGNPATVLMTNPALVEHADLVLLEGTYGDRNHPNSEAALDELAAVLAQAAMDGGNVFIPAFALGRSQEVLYYLAKLHYQKRLVQQQIFLDSPMAIEILKLYQWCFDALDEADLKAIGYQPGMALQQLLPMLTLTASPEASMAINQFDSGAIVIAGSGMCNGGRILHHFKHNLWKPNNHVIFVGFQAAGSLGRMIVDGVKTLKIYGEEIAVKAKIHQLSGLSAHAGQADLLAWASQIQGAPQFYLVHGELPALEALQQKLQQLGIKAQIPSRLDRICF
ncbi:MBL fold metallo-hydrolase [Rheinheimera sp.]|uniref:MBL fold metallo-hydrolase n=1 Tax=Rheinheimera sp. TaxID=1869214 RepID=UPI002FDE86B1